MIMNQIKKWSDLSTSPFKPLFWILMGPMLLLLTLMVMPSADFLFFFLSFFALLLIWKFRFNGLLLSLLGVIACESFCFLFEEGLNFWKISWLVCLSLTFVISFLCFEEIKSYYLKLKKESEKQISHLKGAFHELKEKGSSEKRQIEIKGEKLEERLSEANREIKALLQLVDASRIEAQKTYDQNQMLSAESLKQYREIETLKKEEEAREKKLVDLEEKCRDFSRHLKDFLKRLNFFRTEYQQLQILFEISQREFKKFRELILTQREKLKKKEGLGSSHVPSKFILKAKNEIPFDLILKILEKDKGVLKKRYEEIQLDYKRLSQHLKKANPDESNHLGSLKNQLLEKEKKLHQARGELIHLEREIFLMKKKMQTEETHLPRAFSS